MSKAKKVTLEWNVYCENINSGEIETHNICDRYLYEGLDTIKKDYKKEFKAYLSEIQKTSDNDALNKKIQKWIDAYKNGKFSEALNALLMRRYWSRCEYEVVITSWPPRISPQEVERLSAEKKSLYGHLCPNLEIEEKVDIYSQIKLNWNIFVDYIWNNFIEI